MLKGYPKVVVIDDGTRVTLRPMVAEDRERLIAFFQSIPEEERWYLKEDVADAEVIDSWVRCLDYERVLPIVAVVDDEIVADATLHRRTYGGSRHVGKLRIVVSPKYRNKGMGTWMVMDIVNAALSGGVEKLMAEMVAGKQEIAREGLKRVGFIEEAVISDYARDPDGVSHDLIMMTRTFYPDWGGF